MQYGPVRQALLTQVRGLSLFQGAHTSTENRERFGIHCAIDTDPDIDMPLQESQP